MVILANRKLILVFLALNTLPGVSSAQQEIRQNQKFEEMSNAMLLTLEERGLELGLELIGDKTNPEIRANALMFLADYFFGKGIEQEEFPTSGSSTGSIAVKTLARSYALYGILVGDYPQSRHREKASQRMAFLAGYAREIAYISDRLGELSAEYYITSRKLKPLEVLFTIREPLPLQFFFEGDFQQSPQEIANRYFDEIIVNHPTFEVIGYYFKALVLLDKVSVGEILTKSIVPIKYRKMTYAEAMKIRSRGMGPGLADAMACISTVDSLTRLLTFLEQKYATHTLVLDLHLIMARTVMEKDKDGRFTKRTLHHLSAILRNETDKTSFRYLLVKEFVASNKFLDNDIVR